jgi:glutaredoxin-like protein
MAGDAEVRFYWRPGCFFCRKLRRKLDGVGILYQPINIWEDSDAAATVRSVAGGNETVPTVFVGEHAMVNPSLDTVLSAIRAESPAENNAPTPEAGGTGVGEPSQGVLAGLLDRLRSPAR